MAGYEYSFDFSVPLPAPREEVFRALSDEKALRRWFAEHVEVEPREGGAFRFWGRHTYGTPDEAQADQRITHFEPDVSIGFTWRLLDRVSTVKLTLRDDRPDENGKAEPATRIHVEHRFDSLPDMNRAEAFIDDLWRIYTGSLLEYTMGKEQVFRPDYSADEARVLCSLEIDAPPAAVFRVLTTPELISKWFPAPAPVVEPRVGGNYGFGISYEMDGKTVEPPPCTILEYEQDRKLAITWPDWRGDESVPDQKVTWSLEDLGGRTRLVLVHDGFTRPVDISDYPFGWRHFMEEIGKVAEAETG